MPRSSFVYNTLITVWHGIGSNHYPPTVEIKVPTKKNYANLIFLLCDNQIVS